VGDRSARHRKPVILSPSARQDIDDAIFHYLVEGGAPLADRFTDALASAFERLSYQPAMGSPRYAALLNLPEMRCWPLRPWPQLLFYLDRERAVDIVRVLHGARDIPALLAEPDDGGE